ncbi:hypothetical protein BDW22DRAFT_1426523 [Trametopsis cervina]|nr:hypothetical protein BDW22DRAFT_1426523 [Trametopsis cervina]
MAYAWNYDREAGLQAVHPSVHGCPSSSAFRAVYFWSSVSMYRVLASMSRMLIHPSLLSSYSPDSKAFVTQIHVLPGTHHFKFIVDDQWRITDQYPTAVDDLDGSLSNYVNANSPTSTSPSSVSPQQTPHPNHANHFASFWSDSSSRDGSGSGDGKGEAAWTTIIPQELINAAGEEEHYLASAGGSPSTSSSVPAPNIPPAPVLPRHLDKLILNVRPQIVGAPGSPGETARTKKDKEREKEKSRRERREREGRSRGHTPSHLGMTSSTHDGGDDGSGSNAHLALPVVTASGTDVTAVYGSSSPSTPAEREEGGGAHLHAKKPSIHASATNKLVDVLALADDASVLPVPSHVVLHHLSTSAIKSGVLAVANTTRYKKKYITTIYYKPT